MREIPRDKTVLFEPDINIKLNEMFKQSIISQFNELPFDEEADFSDCGGLLKRFFDKGDRSSAYLDDALPLPFAVDPPSQESKPSRGVVPHRAGPWGNMLVGEFKIDWALAHSYEDKLAELWELASNPPAEDAGLSDFQRREKFFDGVLDYTGGVIKLARDTQFGVSLKDTVDAVMQCKATSTPPMSIAPLPPPPTLSLSSPRFFTDVISTGGLPMLAEPAEQPVRPTQPAQPLQAALPPLTLSGFLREPPLVAVDPEASALPPTEDKADDDSDDSFFEIHPSDFLLSASTATTASVVSLPMTVTGSGSSFRMPPDWVMGSENPFFTCIMRSERTDTLMYKVLDRIALLYLAGSGHLFEAFKCVGDKRHFYNDIWLKAHLSLLETKSGSAPLEAIQRIKKMLIKCCKKPRGAERDAYIEANSGLFLDYEESSKIPIQERLRHYFSYYIDFAWGTLASKMTDDKELFLKQVAILCGTAEEGAGKSNSLLSASREQVAAWADEFMRAADAKTASEGPCWLNKANLRSVAALASLATRAPQSRISHFFGFT
ncbi:MAG: hypothetical protein P1U63_08150 [Coxiellaceae bacterium]|nr:hypothetical protein [Coxiellaceae bacterium]